MYNPFDANVRREQAHAMYVETALDVLARPAVADALGERAVEMAGLIGDSFVVPRVDDMLVLPANQKNTANVGVHPVTRLERTMPALDYAEWLRADDQALVSEADADEWTKLVEGSRLASRQSLDDLRLPRIDDPYTVRANTPFALPDGRWVALRGRGIVMIRTGTYNARRASDLLMTAAIVHEFDHARPSARSNEYDLRAIQERAKKPQKAAANLVNRERTAYAVTAKVLSVIEDAVDVRDTVEARLKGLSPEEAGMTLAEMVRPAFWDRFMPLSERRLYTVAAGAMHLTRRFGNGSPTATRAEVTAYQRAQLIHGI